MPKEEISANNSQLFWLNNELKKSNWIFREVTTVTKILQEKGFFFLFYKLAWEEGEREGARA